MIFPSLTEYNASAAAAKPHVEVPAGVQLASVAAAGIISAMTLFSASPASADFRLPPISKGKLVHMPQVRLGPGPLKGASAFMTHFVRSICQAK
jgi:hypothetical protein